MSEGSVVQVPLGSIAQIDRGISWDISQERSEFSDDSLPVLRIPNIRSTLATDDLIYLKIPGLSSVQRWTARPGSIIMVGSNGNASRVGNVAFIEGGREFLFASFLFGIRPSARVDARYLFHFLASPRCQDGITRSVQGTTGLKNLSKSYVKSIPVPMPPLGEQHRIAEVLDTADEAVWSTERCIAKLEQAKNGLMFDLFSNAVTDSRRSNATSTISADSPDGAYWRALRIGDFTRVNVGYVGPIAEYFCDSDDGVPLLSTTNISNDGLTLGKMRYVSHSFDRANLKSRVTG